MAYPEPDPTGFTVQQAPYEGVSMLYALDDAKAEDRHELQYFEIFCNRGIYHKGWTAVTRHGVPWLGSYDRSFDDDVWELYDTNTDWSQSKDLAKENPEKLRELQRLFLIEATKYNVIPFDDRTLERFNSELAGRPQLIKGDSQILFGGMARLSEGSMVVTHNKSYSVTAEVEVPEAGAQGVIVAIGGGVGGWSLYAHEGRRGGGQGAGLPIPGGRERLGDPLEAAGTGSASAASKQRVDPAGNTGHVDAGPS